MGKGSGRMRVLQGKLPIHHKDKKALSRFQTKKPRKKGKK